MLKPIARRAKWLALNLFFVTLSFQAYGHSLPDSELTFSEAHGELHLELSFPLEDFTIALPALAHLMEVKTPALVTQQDAQQIQQYFTAHMRLEHKQQALTMSLKQAILQTDYHHDLGNYVTARLKFVAPLTAPLDEYDERLLTLHYDAIMHEVRSHRANLYWQKKDKEKVRLTSFVYKKIDGKPATYLIARP